MSVLIPGEKLLENRPSFKCVGMDDAMSEIMSVLIRKHQSSVILTGPKGVGRSTLCLGLQKLKSDGRFDMSSKRMFWLDSDSMFADDKRVVDAWSEIVTVLERTSGSILVIENAADFISSAKSAGHDHFVNSLIRMIRDGETQVIAEVSDDSFDVLFKSHSGVNELFTVIDVHEPIDEDLKSIVSHVSTRLSSFHSIRIEEDAVVAALELTTKYRDATRAQPSRAITLLDRSVAALRLRAHEKVSPEDRDATVKLSQKMRDAEDSVIAAEAALNEERDKQDSGASSAAVKSFKRIAGKSSDMTAAGKAARAVLDAAVDKRDAIAREMETLTGRVNASVTLSRADVVAEFSSITGIPVAKLSEDDREKLRSLERRLLGRIFGQDAAVRHVANMVKTSRVGHRSGGRPKGACMFMGPSGVGKTEMAKALAQELFGDEKALFRIDMSEYMEKHAVAKLIGAPPGYEGFEAGGILTNGIRKRPVCVLLLDEIEKAHPDVFNIFLQILGDGRLTDNVGRVVSFADVYVICTTNIGQTHYLDSSITPEIAHERTMRDLDATYRPEFLNRFGGRKDIIHFSSLPVDVIAKIVQRELNQIAEAYRPEGVDLVVAPDAVMDFCKSNYDPRTGARGLPGHLRSTLEPIVADIVLEKSVDNRVAALVRYDKASKNLVATKEGGK